MPAPSLEHLLRARSAYGGHFDSTGRRLLFVSDLAEVPQVWALAPAARWPALAFAPPDRAQTLHPGPGGRWIVGGDLNGDERRQLYGLGEDGEAARPLVDAPEVIHGFGGWSPDGQQVAFSSNARTGRWFDVYLHHVASGETRPILQADATTWAGEFAPDGRNVLATRAFSNTHGEVWLVPVDGSGDARRLSPSGEVARFERPQWRPDGQAVLCLTDHGREFAGAAWLHLPDGRLEFVVAAKEEVDDAALSPDGRTLAYALNHDGASEVRLHDLASGAERTVMGLPPGAPYEYWQSGLQWSPTGRQLAVSWTASRFPPAVWTVDPATGRDRQATFPPAEGVRAADLVEPEHVTYPTFDGRQIPALWYPPRRGARLDGRKPPCVVFVHGGPESQFRPTFNPVVQYLVGSGFAVLAPNVRGSSGYGKTYLSLDDVEKRPDSVADLAHAAYWLRDSGRADPKRLAVYGGSYGGFMVLAALTSYPDQWAAGVDLVGIANFVTFLENTGPWRRHLREAEYGSLERDRAFLERLSPIHQVERITAPLLVIHGRNDPRVPIGEAEQMVARLRALGRTVEFLPLEDEGHQIAKLKNKLVAYPLAVRFLQQHLA